MSLFDVIKSLEEKFSYKKEAIVNGIKFELTLLNYEQDQLVNAFPEGSDDPLAFYERTRMHILSYAIISINGETIPQIVEIKTGDKVETKEKSIYIREFLKKLPPKILEQLFDIYIDFKEEIDNNLDKGIEYSWYKTPDVREADRKKKEKEFKKKQEEENASVEASEEKPIENPEDKPIVFNKINIKEDEEDKVEQG